MLQLTDTAASKVKEIMTQQNPAPSALRVAVVGGGCSGFSYHMAFDSQENPSDQNPIGPSLRWKEASGISLPTR